MNNSVIEQIKNRLPIEEVLSSYITLIPSGSQRKAKCPFHNERTASFSISPERGQYYCFGCGAKGDIFTFVQEFEGIDFKGALKILADRAGIVLSAYEPTNKGQLDETERLFDTLESAAKKYEAQLQNNPAAVAYLTSRGVSPETIAAFRLGYAPDEWRYLSGNVSSSDAQYMERAGLIKKTDKPASPGGSQGGGYYDRFRGRIMFPLSDSSGRIVGFSGRMFPDTPEGPKYLNSPETEVFQKSRILFGFDKAKQAIRKHNFAVMVEGQMDLVLSHQAGFKNTVATSGTAVSEQSATDMSAQLVVLSRLTPNIFLAFDGDAAGEKALGRAALVALSLGMNPKVVNLPEGIDPADYILKEGVDAWKTRLKESKHYIVHTLSLVRQKATSAHSLKLLIREKVFPFLMRVTSNIERQTYIQDIARETGISSTHIISDFTLFEKESKQESPVAFSEKQKMITQSFSAKERFVAFLSLFDIPRVTAERERIESFSFEGEAIVLPDNTLDEALQQSIESAYGALDDDEKVLVAKELAEAVIAQFLEALKLSYSLKMSQARENSDDENELRYLGLLQKINQYRHKD